MTALHQTSEMLLKMEKELKTVKSASELVKKAGDDARYTIEEARDQLENLIEEFSRLSNTTLERSEKLNESTQSTLDVTDSLVKKIDDINFPSRLEKLDATISGINAGLQNILGRVDDIERNLKDEVRDKLALQETVIKSAFTAQNHQLETNLKAETADGLTALQTAVEEKLVAAETNLKAETADGLTALQTAVEEKLTAVEANLKAETADGLTTLQTAVEEKLTAVEANLKEVYEARFQSQKKLTIGLAAVQVILLIAGFITIFLNLGILNFAK